MLILINGRSSVNGALINTIYLFCHRQQVKMQRDRLDPTLAAARVMEEAAYDTYLLQGEHELKYVY